jgi:hypothetical protein
LWAKQFPLGLAQWLWDNYFLIVKIPPYVWTKAQLAEKKKLIENKIVKPMPLAPWTTVENPYPALWQFTARADPTTIPGHPAIKKAVDYNIVYMPLTGVPIPPLPIFVDYIVINARINVRASSSSSSAWVRYAVQDEIVHIVKFENGYAQMTDGNWVYAQYITKLG